MKVLIVLFSLLLLSLDVVVADDLKIRPITCRWVFTTKPPETPGGEEKFKSRLVARGFQDPTIGTAQSDSPTASKDSFKMQLSFAGNEKWPSFFKIFL